jgi:ferredoxin--NADP+ reductase
MTEDGSRGQKADVVLGMKALMDRGVVVDAVWAAGSLAMMKSAEEFTRPRGIKTTADFEWAVQ